MDIKKKKLTVKSVYPFPLFVFFYLITNVHEFVLKRIRISGLLSELLKLSYIQ